MPRGCWNNLSHLGTRLSIIKLEIGWLKIEHRLNRFTDCLMFLGLKGLSLFPRLQFPWSSHGPRSLNKYSHFLRGTSYIKCHGLTECSDLVYYKRLSLMFFLWEMEWLSFFKIGGVATLQSVWKWTYVEIYENHIMRIRQLHGYMIYMHIRDRDLPTIALLFPPGTTSRTITSNNGFHPSKKTIEKRQRNLRHVLSFVDFVDIKIY